MEMSRRRNLDWDTVLVMVGLVIVSLVSTTSPGVSAQAPISVPAGAPSPAAESPDCFTAILNMSDCLTYVEAGSKLTTPEKGCCPSLAGLVESSPICLCQLLGNSSSSLGIQLDVKRAVNLPKVCKVDTPPVSLCAAIGIPVNISPARQGPISPGAGPVSSMGPDTMAPSSKNGKDGSSSTRNSTNIFLVGIIVMIFFFF